MTATLTTAVAGVALVYLAQIATPLRVNYDSTEYLLLAARFIDGSGYPDGASFPPGLPALIAGLDVVGAARPWGIVLMNTAFVAAGLLALARMLRRDLRWGPNAVLAVVLATLLAAPLIRWTSHPLSEAPFLGLSLMALAAAAEARRRRRLWPLALACVLTLAAIATRTFGIVLVPALIAGLPTRRQQRIAAPLVAILGVVCFLALGPARYLTDAADKWKDDPLLRVFWQIRDQLQIAGELAVNVPLDRVPGAVDWLYLGVGAAVVVLGVLGAASIARRAPVLVTYLAASAALLLAWPLPDARLAVPALPVLAVCVGAGVARLPRPARNAGVGWALAFAGVGVVALVLTTRISFAGDGFPERFGHDSVPMRATYRVAWGSADATDRRQALPRTLWVLRRFEPRARGEPGPLPPP